MDALPGFDEKRRATKRFMQYVGEKAFSRTFTSLADELNVDEKTIRNIFTDYVTDLEKRTTFTTPRWLGIDEINVAGQPRCVLANVEKHSIFDMLKNRKRDTVEKRLKQMNASAVELVAMDMWTSYRAAANTVFRDATVVIDKFHVVRMANGALEKVRKSLRDGMTDRQRRTLMHDRFLMLRRERDLKPEKKMMLDAWLGAFPDLKSAYDLKEDFFNIWDQDIDSKVAREQYNDWRERVPATIAWSFQDLTTALKNWEPEIFAYFDHRITNAYTESFNNLIRTANRVGRGYSFKALRAKMLYLPNATTRKNHRSREGDAITADEADDTIQMLFRFVSTVAKKFRQTKLKTVSTVA
jgi:transposase